jgi:uncharacterized membrane protein
MRLHGFFNNQNIIGTLMKGFITDNYPDGRCSVFVSTGPNPITGFIFHLKRESVHPVNVSVEEAIRSVISCGATSGKLIKAYSETVDNP